MRYILVINSRNSKSNNKKFEDAVLRIFQENSELRSRMELKYTEYPGHATDVAVEVANKYKGSVAIVTVGGDGTIHEVANALAFHETPLIPIPFGTGNDFVKTSNPSWKKWTIYDYLTNLDNVTYKPIDLIKLDSFDMMGNFIPGWSAYINNVASIGLDTKVQSDAKALVEAHNTEFTRNTAYVRAAFKNLFGDRAHKFTYKLDLEDGTTVSGDSTEYTLISICNGKYYGDGFTPAPHASLDSGVANICVVDNVGTMKAISLILKYRSGKHEGKKGIHTYRATSGIITSGDASMQLCGNYDGEDFFGHRVRFEVCPAALNLGYFE